MLCILSNVKSQHNMQGIGHVQRDSTFTNASILEAPAPIHSNPWQPYESSPQENYLLPCMPVQFYQLRWAFMRWNPLTWTVGCRSFTYGEAIVATLVILQMAWVCVMWAADPSFRVDVLLTGVFPTRNALVLCISGHCCSLCQLPCFRMTHFCQSS